MATQGFQIILPSGAPASWGTGTGDRSFQRFTGTTSAASSALTANRWHTVRNDGTVAVNIALGASTVTATSANIAIQPGEQRDFVVIQGANFIAAFAAGSGADLKLWMSEAST